MSSEDSHWPWEREIEERKAIYLHSPNGWFWKISIDNEGNLQTHSKSKESKDQIKESGNQAKISKNLKGVSKCLLKKTQK